MRQVTLVALYGEKEPELVNLIQDLQKLVEQAVPPNAFQPYDPLQVHATIVGLEKEPRSNLMNSNFLKYRKQREEMNLEGFLNYLRDAANVPFQIQVGGFDGRDYPFKSPSPTGGSPRPYDRSFSIQQLKGKKDRVVVMGWPLRGCPFTSAPTSMADYVQESRIYPDTLDAIRQAAQRYGILHSYHRDPKDRDNDLFFRIGLLDPGTAPGTLEADARNHLTKVTPPLVLNVTLRDLFIVGYEDDQLPLATSRPWSIADRRVTSAFVQTLYDC